MKLLFLHIILLFLFNTTFAQIFVEKDLENGINYIVDFINSEEFNKLKTSNSDLALVDSIYLRAKHFYNGDISETLLALTFATLPFRKMPLHIPYTKITLDAKLPSGDPNVVKQKISNLPKRIFFDSPKSKFGDKDKTAHFFGNAYLSHSVSLFNLSKFLSIFVELFEDTFKIEGSISKRDFIANHLGYLFGKELHEHPNSLPSKTLKKYPVIKNNFEAEYE